MLALRDSGAAPRLLADQVVGTVSMDELFLIQDRESAAGFSNAAPAVGVNFYTPALIVPPGELWYVWHYAVVCQPGAGAAIDLAAAVNLDGLSLTCTLGDFVAAAAAQQVRARADLPFWAGPGSQMGFVTRSVTLAPTVNAGIAFTRLRI